MVYILHLMQWNYSNTLNDSFDCHLKLMAISRRSLANCSLGEISKFRQTYVNVLVWTKWFFPVFVLHKTQMGFNCSHGRFLNISIVAEEEPNCYYVAPNHRTTIQTLTHSCLIRNTKESHSNNNTTMSCWRQVLWNGWQHTFYHYLKF